jgi:hypothetical protein
VGLINVKELAAETEAGCSMTVKIISWERWLAVRKQGSTMGTGRF